MSPFFCTRKSIPQPVRCKSKPLDGTPQCAFTVFASPQPACRITPKKTSSYRGCGSPETGYRYPSRESRLPPHPLWLFPAWGDLARDSDRHPVHPPAHPYGFARFAYPRAVRPPRHVPRQRMGGGTAGMFCPRRAGGEMTEGKAAPPSPLRRPAEGVQGLEQAMARHAGDCDRAGGCRRIHAKRRALSHLACFLAVMPSCPILR